MCSSAAGVSLVDWSSSVLSFTPSSVLFSRCLTMVTSCTMDKLTVVAADGLTLVLFETVSVILADTSVTCLHSIVRPVPLGCVTLDSPLTFLFCSAPL